eukprot:689000-Rhodomonas_salina.3
MLVTREGRNRICHGGACVSAEIAQSKWQRDRQDATCSEAAEKTDDPLQTRKASGTRSYWRKQMQHATHRCAVSGRLFLDVSCSVQTGQGNAGG